MTDEGADTGSKTTSPESAELEARLRALKEQLELIGAALDRGIADSATIEQWQMLIAFVAGNFSAAFVQTLGQRAADGAVKRVGDLVQTHVRRKGKPDETRIGVDDGSAATIGITEDTPDEARLALLDLDVTADELRGKLLHWDSSASAWRPADD